MKQCVICLQQNDIKHQFFGYEPQNNIQFVEPENEVNKDIDSSEDIQYKNYFLPEFSNNCIQIQKIP